MQEDLHRLLRGQVGLRLQRLGHAGYPALRTERMREEALTTSLPASLSGRPDQPPPGTRNWRRRPARAMTFPGRCAAVRFVDDVCRPAFRDVAGELREQGAEAVLPEGVTEENGLSHVGLQVPIEPGDVSRGAPPGVIEPLVVLRYVE
ncbi:hypothetical protein NGM36_33770 [Streptomyces mutabilis]|uniref:hypothetical protein n=1 Tax=Streptomyces mutabilis TaxID=67332 RepID=UPI0022BA1E02|nr:hypothetical protein [Streptomyces mutabilis]MCZ9354682.1 hypothetical protein [Streptomyces mutabilis]